MPYDFTLTIHCLSEAFNNNRSWDFGHDVLEEEVARILRDTADRICKGKLYEKCVRDVNGNICGKVGFQHISEKQAALRKSKLAAMTHMNPTVRPKTKRG
jgi:hypothetical protein